MDDLHAKLRRMVKTEGADVVTLGGMCEVLLRKYLADHPEAVRALAYGVETGVANQIRKTPNAMAREMLAPNWQQTLMSGGLTSDQARWIIDSWADALDANPEQGAGDEDYEPEKRRRRVAPDVDAALYLLLALGVGIHVLVFLAFNFTYTVFLEGDDLIEEYMPMEEMFRNLYLVFMPISAIVSLTVFSAITALYGQDMPLERVLRNFFCLFTYASGIFAFVIMLGWYTGILIGAFLAMGTFTWLLNFYGFRVFIIASIMHLFQYAIYVILMLLSIIPMLHQYGVKWKDGMDDDDARQRRPQVQLVAQR